MKFSRHLLYKHKSNTDVAIEVLRIPYRGSNCIKARVAWYNIAGEAPFSPMNILETIKIKNKDLSKWEAYYYLNSNLPAESK